MKILSSLSHGFGMWLMIRSYRFYAPTLSDTQLMNKLRHWLQSFEREIEQDESANQGADITGRRET